MKHGANPHDKDVDNRTAYDTAVFHHHTKLAGHLGGLDSPAKRFHHM